MTNDQYAVLGQALLTAADTTVPEEPLEFARAAFAHPDWSNARIAQELTPAPRGSREWNSVMRTLQRWRSYLTGGPGQQRRPSPAGLQRLRQARVRSQMVLRQIRGVYLTGSIELVYREISQGARQLGNIGNHAAIDQMTLVQLYDTYGADTVRLGRALVEAVTAAGYGPGVYAGSASAIGLVHI
jgi:hypothetical protein